MKIIDNRAYQGGLMFHDAKPGELYEETVTRSVYLCIFLDGRRLLFPAGDGKALSSDCVERAFPEQCRFRHLDARLEIV